MKAFRLACRIICLLLSFASFEQLLAQQLAETRPVLYLPAVTLAAHGPTSPPPIETVPLTSPQDRINRYRAAAGVPTVIFDAQLNNNCYQHARYIAEENHLTHEQRVDSPWHTPGGQSCAEHANVWLGHGSWPAASPVDWWMRSSAHRLWLLYPTTTTFGHGFATSESNRSGSALDVLSHFDPSNDHSYGGWPVRYPAPNQGEVPDEIYPITLFWPYSGPAPSLESSTLETAGRLLPHTTTTEFPGGHRGIELLPDSALPASSEITVTVRGRYNNRPFEYRWTFFTRASSRTTSSALSNRAR